MLLIKQIFFLIYDTDKERSRTLSFNFIGELPNSKEFDESRTSSDLPVFDLLTIAKATDHFSFTNKLGEGGFGAVYKVKYLTLLM